MQISLDDNQHSSLKKLVDERSTSIGRGYLTLYDHMLPAYSLDLDKTLVRRERSGVHGSLDYFSCLTFSDLVKRLNINASARYRTLNVDADARLSFASEHQSSYSSLYIVGRRNFVTCSLIGYEQVANATAKKTHGSEFLSTFGDAFINQNIIGAGIYVVATVTTDTDTQLQQLSAHFGLKTGNFKLSLDFDSFMKAVSGKASLALNCISYGIEEQNLGNGLSTETMGTEKYNAVLAKNLVNILNDLPKYVQGDGAILSSIPSNYLSAHGFPSDRGDANVLSKYLRNADDLTDKFARTHFQLKQAQVLNVVGEFIDPREIDGALNKLDKVRNEVDEDVKLAVTRGQLKPLPDLDVTTIISSEPKPFISTMIISGENLSLQPDQLAVIKGRRLVVSVAAFGHTLPSNPEEKPRVGLTLSFNKNPNADYFPTDPWRFLDYDEDYLYEKTTAFHVPDNAEALNVMLPQRWAPYDSWIVKVWVF